MFSKLDLVEIKRNEINEQMKRDYWKYFKAKLKREGDELSKVTA